MVEQDNCATKGLSLRSVAKGIVERLQAKYKYYIIITARIQLKLFLTHIRVGKSFHDFLAFVSLFFLTFWVFFG